MPCKASPRPGTVGGRSIGYPTQTGLESPPRVCQSAKYSYPMFSPSFVESHWAHVPPSARSIPASKVGPEELRERATRFQTRHLRCGATFRGPAPHPRAPCRARIWYALPSGIRRRSTAHGRRRWAEERLKCPLREDAIAGIWSEPPRGSLVCGKCQGVVVPRQTSTRQTSAPIKRGPVLGLTRTRREQSTGSTGSSREKMESQSLLRRATLERACILRKLAALPQSPVFLGIPFFRPCRYPPAPLPVPRRAGIQMVQNRPWMERRPLGPAFLPPQESP